MSCIARALDHASGSVFDTRGVIIKADPGKKVMCLLNEDHLHGVTADQFMEHPVLGESDGTSVWLERVSDDKCRGSRTNS
jgi:hypothetical protein